MRGLQPLHGVQAHSVVLGRGAVQVAQLAPLGFSAAIRVASLPAAVSMPYRTEFPDRVPAHLQVGLCIVPHELAEVQLNLTGLCRLYRLYRSCR